ncbi:MAG TPA: arsenate reductase ArsC [bacterium]|nr:arsenate reductase ArsC [bacterium]
MSESKPTVLFLCTTNTCRSQIAEALLRHLARDRFIAVSAGLAPGEVVLPLALQVLHERDIDTTGLRPKHICEFLGIVRIRTAITVCARVAEACPEAWPGALEQIFWPIDNPVVVEGTGDQRLDAFRRTRDTIESKLRDWLAVQDQPQSPATATRDLLLLSDIE